MTFSGDKAISSDEEEDTKQRIKEGDKPQLCGLSKHHTINFKRIRTL
jgi:hypothetical protein